MKYYLVPNSSNPAERVKIGASGFAPANGILLSPELAQEDARCLIVSTEVNEHGEELQVVSVDQAIKAQLAANEAASAQAQVLRDMVRNAKSFGSQIVEDFTIQNVLLGITADNMTGTVLNRMANVILALQSGSLHEAISRAKSVPAEHKDAKYITDARLLAAVNAIETYLNLPLSTHL